MWLYEYLSGVNTWASKLINHATTARSEKEYPGQYLDVLSHVHHSLAEAQRTWEHVSVQAGGEMWYGTSPTSTPQA